MPGPTSVNTASVKSSTGDASSGTLIKQRAYVAPESHCEQVLAEIWGEVLGVARVGRFDHFFDLGGHSLAATRIIVRCRRQLAGNATVKLLFERPVLADFAAGMAVAATAETAIVVRRLSPDIRGGILREAARTEPGNASRKRKLSDERCQILL